MAGMTAVDPIDAAEDGFDLRRLGRSALWGGFAIAAMLAAIMAAHSEAGLRRITLALNGMPPSGQFSPTAGGTLIDLPVRDPAAEAETRRLAESVRRLAADRDRLMARLDTLERSIEVTGALPPAASQRPPEAPASVTSVPAALPHGRGGHGSGGSGSGGSDAAAMAPDDRTWSAAAPMDPVARASPRAEAPASSPIVPSPLVASHTAAKSSLSRTEFGIDLGGAPNSEALRALWSTVRAQHGALLEDLHPVATTRETGKPGASELRLVAGPLLNAAAAARLCAVLASTGRTCQPSLFDGQRQTWR